MVLGPISCGADPGWWEQMAKNGACMALVRAHERATGVRYDFVTKLRSEYLTVESMASAEGSAEVVAAPMHRMHKGEEPPGVWVKGWAAQSCYGQVDWFALMPRALADAYFGLLPRGATCAWAADMAKAVRQRDAYAARTCPTLNERVLVEWLAGQGARVLHNAHDATAVRHACHLRQHCGREGVSWCGRTG